MKKRITIFKAKPVDIDLVIALEERRAKLFGQAVREIMDSEGLSWSAAKDKLQQELKLLTMGYKMSQLKSA